MDLSTSSASSSCTLNSSSPSAPAVATSSSYSSPSSCSSTPDYLVDLFTRRKRKSFKYEPQIRHQRKLESHRKYDHKRRFVLQGIFEDLRQGILESNHLAKKSKQIIENETAGKQMILVNGEDCICDNEDDEGEEESGPTMKELEHFSQSALFYEVVKAIKKLCAIKEKLEEKMNQSEIEVQNVLIGLKRTFDQDGLDFSSFARLGSSFASPCLSSCLSGSQSLSSSASQTENLFSGSDFAVDDQRHVDFLISAVDEAVRLYSEECAKIEALVQNGPRVISLTGDDVLPPYAFFGLNAVQLISFGRSSIIRANLPANELLNLWEGDIFMGSHRPHLVQLYSICRLLAKDFTLTQQLEQECDDSSPDFIDRSIYESFHTPFSSSSPNLSSSSLCPFPFSTSSSSSPSFSEIDDHPLASFAIPPGAFQVARIVLNWLSSLEELEYEQLMSQLRRMGRNHPEVLPMHSIRIPSTGRITAVDTPRSELEFVWHDYWKITHSQIKAFAALFNGESFVSCTGLTVPSPTDRVLHVDVDCTLLQHSKSGHALGIIMFLRKMYLGKKFVELDHGDDMK